MTSRWAGRFLSTSIDVGNVTKATGIGDTGDGVILTAQGDSYGQGVITKLTYAGTVAWQKSFSYVNPVTSVSARSSPAPYLADSNILYKLDGATGAISWQRNIGAVTGYSVHTLKLTPDLSYIYAVSGSPTGPYVVKVSSDNTVSYALKYNYITNEHSGLLVSDSDVFMAGSVSTGTHYLKLTKLSSAFAVTWSKKYSNASHSLDRYSECMLDSGNIVIAAIATGSVDTLRLVCIQPDGTVLWSKSVTDSAITDYSDGGVSVHEISGGFVVFGSESTTYEGVAYKFANDGTLGFARTLSSGTSGVWGGGWGAVSTTDGNLLLSYDLDDANGDINATYFLLGPDGYPLTTFGSIATVANRTSVTVASGITYTVASDTSPSVTNPSLTISAGAGSVTTTAYPLTMAYVYVDSTHQATGLEPATQHGTPSASYNQPFSAAGNLVTKHGTPIYYSVPLDTTAYFASGSFYTNHGTPTVSLDFSGQASGNLVTNHGMPDATLDFAATTSGLVTNHGTPVLSGVFSAEGLLATQHGTPSLEFVVYAAGNLVTKHGTPTLGLVGEYVATGNLVTQHGTPSYTGSAFLARSTPPSLRHGKPLLVRTPTC